MAKKRIFRGFARTPTSETDGTASWSLATLKRALRSATDGLPRVSTYTIRQVLNEAGFSFQRSRSWCSTGPVVHKRKRGMVIVVDPDAAANKLIKAAYTQAASHGQDEAGPFQAVSHEGSSWRPEGSPARRPHEYVRGGTAKMLALFRPADGLVRVQGATSTTNVVLHVWMKRELSEILTASPSSSSSSPTASSVEASAVSLESPRNRPAWDRWQVGLTRPITLPQELPPLRVLLLLDNVTGHRTPDLELWLFAQGVMPLYTPLGGSWLNTAKSVQRILKRRAFDGQHLKTTDEVIAPLEHVANY